MNKPQPTLYLMLGYPGSGKTTTSKIIHDITGAVHLWADKIRAERYDTPTHSHQENIELYNHLNQVTDELLATGQSVIFDTNFNFYQDREKLRNIASKHTAKNLIIWVKAPKELAKQRAVTQVRFPYKDKFPPERFDRISRNLQPPRPGEATIEVDGTKVTKAYIESLLHQHV